MTQILNATLANAGDLVLSRGSHGYAIECPVGGLIDRSMTSVGPSPSEPLLDQAKYLHHAGSPALLALTALGVQPARVRRRSRPQELLHCARNHRSPRGGIGNGADELCDFLVSEPDREQGA
jgi:hypothetical protein